jgi:hypothetical protein
MSGRAKENPAGREVECEDSALRGRGGLTAGSVIIDL